MLGGRGREWRGRIGYEAGRENIGMTYILVRMGSTGGVWGSALDMFDLKMAIVCAWMYVCTY